MPSASLALGQLLIGPPDFAPVAACPHQAIGGTHGVPYLAVVAVYVIADVAIPIRRVPGGLGIIESVVLTFLSGEIVVGGFIVFSVTYYFVPLILGAIMVALSELPLPRRRISTQN